MSKGETKKLGWRQPCITFEFLLRAAREQFQAAATTITHATAKRQLADQDAVEDTARWLDMQEAANQADHGLKVSSFPYTEGPRKFGCNAALLHLYISATGDVWPCDFVPVTFGNVLREDVGEIYRRMHAEAGIYRQRCWAKPLAPEFAGRELPVRQEASSEFCRSCNAQPGYGDFFKGLQECLDTQELSEPAQAQACADGAHQLEGCPSATDQRRSQSATQ